MSPISQVCNDLPSSIFGEDGKIPSAGNVCCITSIRREIHGAIRLALIIRLAVIIILHLKARNPQGCNIISTSPQGWCWSQSMIPIPVSPMLHLSDYWVSSRDESNSFEIMFVEVWDNILTYTLGPSWVIIAPWQICNMGVHWSVKDGHLKHFCRNWCILNTLNAYFTISAPRH